MNQEIFETYFPGLIVKEEDREKCENYLKLKGIERYSSLYFAIKDKTDKEIDYELLSQHYRYDVKLRRALHKTISFIEIAMRAAINNAYFNQHVQLSKDRWMSELSDLFGVEYKPETMVKKKIIYLTTDCVTGYDSEEILMLNKLSQKRNLFLIAFAALLLALWILTLIFGNAEDKTAILVLSLILPLVFYGFARLAFTVVSKNSSFAVMCIFYYFFLAGGLLGAVMMLVEFIGGFPNGLSPSFGACGALIVGTLDSARKSIEKEGAKTEREGD